MILKLTKEGLIKGDKNVTQYIYSYLNESFKIEGDVTIRDLMKFSDDEIIDYIFHHQYFKDYKEYIKDKKQEQYLDYIEINLIDYQWDIVGIKDNTKFALDTDDLPEYCDTPIRLGKLTYGENEDNMKDIRLFDLYDTIIREVSYHGKPGNSLEFRKELQKRLNEVIKNEGNI